MKKFAVCYQASFQELKHVKTLTTAAMLMAVSVVLGYFTIEAGPYLKIGFGGVVNQFVYYLFGPVAGACLLYTSAIRTLADRAKAYSQTQKAAGAGRQASVRTQNQNSMSYQTTQRRSAVQQGKNQKKKGKMSLVLVILLILFALSGINYLYRMFMYFIWFL